MLPLREWPPGIAPLTAFLSADGSGEAAGWGVGTPDDTLEVGLEDDPAGRDQEFAPLLRVGGMGEA